MNYYFKLDSEDEKSDNETVKSSKGKEKITDNSNTTANTATATATATATEMQTQKRLRYILANNLPLNNPVKVEDLSENAVEEFLTKRRNLINHNYTHIKEMRNSNTYIKNYNEPFEKIGFSGF